MKGTVLSLCDYTGNMVKPWADDGYDCICVDLLKQDSPHPGVDHYVGDVRNFLPPRTHSKIVMAFAFPPCTNTAVSGARWFKEKGPAAAAESFAVLDACVKILEWCDCPWMVENPISTFSTYWRKPDYKFDPCDFGGYLEPPGDAYTKKTCLWTGNGFVMPEKKRVEPVEGSKMHRLPPSDDRAALRSVTPMGFAQAVFEANGK